MNQFEFAELLNELPDDMIVSANLSVTEHKQRHWYIIPAIAACFVALIAAEVYPKLRMRTPPVTEPSVQTSETVTSVSAESGSTVIQSTTLPEQTAVTSDTVTVLSTVASITEITVSESDLLPEETMQTIQPDTELPRETTAMTELTQSIPKTTAMTESAQSVPETTATSEPQSVTLPIWKGIIDHSESAFDSQIDCSFLLCPEDVDNELRDLYGIPQDFDLSQNSCLLIMICTTYADAAIIDGKITEDGLVLKITCLEKEKTENQAIRCAIPLLENFQIEPENCLAEYVVLTDETEYQSMLTDNLIIMINE